MYNDSLSLVCTSCQKYLFAFDSFQAAWTATKFGDGFSYTITWGEIQKSIGEGCGWCKILMDEIPSYLPFSGKPNPPTPETMFKIEVHFVQAELGPGKRMRTPATIVFQIDDAFIQKYDVHSSSGDPAGKYIVARELVHEVSSDAVFEEVSALLKECGSGVDGHELCWPAHSMPLPTRVIDCKDPHHPRIVLTQGTIDEYAALSYVWGGDQEHKTTSHNIDKYIKEIPISLLPQTIFDAMKATPLLGLRYLWIDSLCIIQDSDDDKAREISQMRRVYQNASVTIVAANGNRVIEGFLQKRKPPPPAIRLPFQCPDRTVGVMSLRSGTTEPKDPVDTRAWCFQERMLACRKLIFASDTVRYECNALSVNIGNANTALWRKRVRLPASLLHPGKKKSSSSGSNALELETAWETLVVNYTSRKLTDDADKLPAFYGIAELFHSEAWNTSRYLAGLWERNLLEELLWQKGNELNIPKPEKYRAPSWSWASVNGVITPAFKMHHWGEDVAECEIISVDVTPKREGMIFGEVKDGTLKLKGVRHSVAWVPKEGKLYVVVKGENSNDELLGSVYADDLGDSACCEGQVWAFPLRSSYGASSMVEGLILVPAIGQEGFLRRVGIFQIPTGKSSVAGIARRWLDAKRREVVII